MIYGYVITAVHLLKWCKEYTSLVLDCIIFYHMSLQCTYTNGCFMFCTGICCQEDNSLLLKYLSISFIFS
jgi:hypothetical protein